MLIKFIIAITVVFNSLTFPVTNLVSSVNNLPQLVKDNFLERREVELKQLPLSLDLPAGEAGWQIQKASISAVEQALPDFLPIRDWGIDSPEIGAKASLVFDSEKDKVLYQEDIDQVLPIASLSKIMTALVVLENIDPEEVVLVSQQAISGYGDRGGLVVNEEIRVRSLLHALLMESSNDAALALAEAAEIKTGNNFVVLMNNKAKELGLKGTKFSDPSGYNSDNVSTVMEIAQLVKYSFGQPLIWEIMKTPMIEMFSVDRKIRHYWINTDKLLARLENVVGGKTGYTEEAGGCLVLVVKENNGHLISVILGAEERFLETERLINWVKKAYQW